MKRFCTILILILFFLSSQFYGQTHEGNFGIRGGLGTDINLGFGYGLGVNYLFPNSDVELAVVLFGHSSEETSVEYNTYNETIDLFVFGIMANYLFGYKYKQPGFYGIVGLGFASISVDWEESSPDDSSLGTPLPGGGSKQSESGTGGGSVLNAGVGYSFGQFSLRGEFPIIVSFSDYGSSSVVLTLMITLGYNF